MDKKALRLRLRRARLSLPPDVRRDAECIINHYLKQFIRRNKRIAVYWAMGGELCLDDFVCAAQKRGAQVYLPYIEQGSRRLWFTPYPNKKQAAEKKWFRQQKLNIPQWRGKKIRASAVHDMILPIVGIDLRGYRLGQGGGFYDCTLAQTPSCLKPRKIAAGFACQMIAHLPHQHHDQRADYFVSEDGITTF